MSNAPHLLNDDGSASIATALMMSHHAFRRDLTRFARGLERVAGGESSRTGALRAEWEWFRTALHHHHEAEDTGVFPSIASAHPSACATIERLGADHRRIDPLLSQGDAAFGQLPRAAAALAVVRELIDILGPHLALEEAELIPFVRENTAFPPPPDDAMAEMYAKGFAWSMDGIAPDVLEQVYAMLPEILRARLPAARAAYAARCDAAWGGTAPARSRTPIPSDTALEP